MKRQRELINEILRMKAQIRANRAMREPPQDYQPCSRQDLEGLRIPTLDNLVMLHKKDLETAFGCAVLKKQAVEEG